MKMHKLISIATALLLTAGAARAVHVWEDAGGWWDAHWKADPSAPLYNPNELNLDLFGTYMSGEERFTKLFEHNIRHGAWGGGAGLSWFFTPQLGIGTDFNVSDWSPSEWRVDYWVGNIYLRFPLGNSGLAPYIYGGGGRGLPIPFTTQIDQEVVTVETPWQWIYGGGVGLEFRFTPATGIFSDARFMFSHEATALNSLTIRAGLRFAF
jgi:hypothetical protein